jgi:glycosyltransferase involved in cell wall biosynthesis
MNIVHYSHCNLGSAEASTAHVMEFAERLVRRGHTVTVVVPRKGLYAQAASCGIRYFPYINVKGLRQITAIIAGFFTLLALHRKFRFDCIYIRRLTLDPLPGLFSRIKAVPLIVETNGQIEIHEHEVPVHALWQVFWYPLLRMFEWFLFDAAFAVTADGSKRLNRFTGRYPAWTSKFHMVRSGGIDLNRFRRIDKAEARAGDGLPDNRRYLVWVGTIFAWSGVEQIIDAAPEICGQCPDVDFLIIGEGPDRQRLMKKAGETGVGNRMRFPGYIATSELFRWLSAGDCALAPYTRLRLDREDFTSYKIFEYLACGLPVVCSYEKGDSNIRVVRDFNLGAAVPPQDNGSFARAVIRILGEPSYFTDEFVMRCRTVLTDMKATWDSLVEQVDSICSDAIKIRKRPKAQGRKNS